MRWSVVLVCAAVVSFAGCQRAEPPAPERPAAAEGFAVDLSEPAATVRSHLRLMEIELATVAERDAAGAAWARQEIHALAATDEIIKTIKRLPTVRDDTQARTLLNDLISNWTSAFAYYADNVDEAGLRVRMVGADEAVVIVPAGPKTRLEFALRAADDGRWTVSEMSFAKPQTNEDATATQPADTQPARE